MQPIPPHSPDRAISVLILDDDRVDRHRLARLCSTLPNPTRITNAQMSRECMTLLDEQCFELLLVDYHLPDGTGLDLLRHIRMSPQNLNAAIIMITGQANAQIEQTAREAGCADYLTKDELTPQTFRRAVSNALQKSVLSTQVVAQTFRRNEVEKVLEHFAGQCARDIKPMLSRMMRQLRNLRAADPGRTADTPSRYDAIEDSCDTLWNFLVALERHQGTDLLPMGLNSPSGDAALPTGVPRKPPSPFARFNS